eukprot:3531623-Rhodomonas_salina.1
MGLGVLILLNFVVNIVNSELLPTPGSSSPSLPPYSPFSLSLLFLLPSPPSLSASHAVPVQVWRALGALRWPHVRR